MNERQRISAALMEPANAGELLDHVFADLRCRVAADAIRTAIERGVGMEQVPAICLECLEFVQDLPTLLAIERVAKPNAEWFRELLASGSEEGG